MLGLGIMTFLLVLFTVEHSSPTLKPSAAWPLLVVILCRARFSAVRNITRLSSGT